MNYSRVPREAYISALLANVTHPVDLIVKTLSVVLCEGISGGWLDP